MGHKNLAEQQMQIFQNPLSFPRKVFWAESENNNISISSKNKNNTEENYISKQQ